MTTRQLDMFIQDLEETKLHLGKARDAGRTFIDAIGLLPMSTDRTHAHGRTEEAIAYIDKLIDEHKD